MVEEKMKKTIVTTIILALVAVGVITYFYMFEKGVETSQKEWEPTSIIDADAPLYKITLIRPLGKIVFEWQNGRWMITDPLKANTSNILMRQFTGTLMNMKKERIIHLHPENLQMYHLENPRAEMTLHFSDDRPAKTLLIGKMNYNKDHLYAKFQSEPAVFLIKPDISPYLNYELNLFRIKSLLFHKPSDVASIEVKILDPSIKEKYPNLMDIKLIKQAQKGMPHKWIYIKPFQEAARAHSVEMLLKRLHANAAERIIDVEEGDYSQYGFDDPKLKIIFTATDGTKEEVLLGNLLPEKDLAYFRNTANDSVIPAGMTTFKLAATVPFRQQLLIGPHEARNVTEVKYEYPSSDSKDFSLVYESPRLFASKDNPSEKVLARRINALKRPFRTVRVNYVADYPPYPREKFGLDNPKLKIKLYENETLSLDVAIGDTVSELQTIYTYVEDLRRQCIVAYPKDLYHHIPWKRDHLVATEKEVEFAKKSRRRHERKRKPDGQESGIE